MCIFAANPAPGTENQSEVLILALDDDASSTEGIVPHAAVPGCISETQRPLISLDAEVGLGTKKQHAVVFILSRDK